MSGMFGKVAAVAACSDASSPIRTGLAGRQLSNQTVSRTFSSP